MDLKGNTLGEQSEKPIPKQQSNGIRVRDMIKRYDTAVKSDSAKTSYSSILSAKSSYFGVNTNTPTADTGSSSLLPGATQKVQDKPGSPARSSSGSRKTLRSSRSPRVDNQSNLQIAPLETQKSFMNLSRSRDPPKAAPREKKPRHSAPVAQQQQEEQMTTADSSYQSKTTISKTPCGVRIIIDIFFDQNKGLTIEDVVGSRVETDIPNSKILTEFQKRVAESAHN